MNPGLFRCVRAAGRIFNRCLDVFELTGCRRTTNWSGISENPAAISRGRTKMCPALLAPVPSRLQISIKLYFKCGCCPSTSHVQVLSFDQRCRALTPRHRRAEAFPAIPDVSMPRPFQGWLVSAKLSWRHHGTPPLCDRHEEKTLRALSNQSFT